MGPHQRHSRAAGFSEKHIGLREIRRVPNLLRQHATAGSKLFHGCDECADVSSRGQFVMGALACEQGPCASDAPAGVWFAIRMRAIAIIVIAPPAWAIRGCDFEHRVNHTQRVFHERLTCLADAIADKLQESGIHHVFGRELPRPFRRTVGNRNSSGIRIFVGRVVVSGDGKNADVVPLDSVYQRTLGGDRPCFDV